MFGVIDRFEGDYAVVEFEDREMQDIKKILMPPEAKEGDVIVFIDGKYVIDKEETAKRRGAAEKLSEGLWE